jgi:hypothetical protein
VATVARNVRAGCILSILMACAGAPPHAAQSTVATPADDALLRDPVLDEVMAEEEARRAARTAHPEAGPATVSSTSPKKAAPAPRTIGVRGITGSLTAFEVEQSMSKRRAALLTCVEQRPHSMSHVAGDIAFHVDVDGQGKVERVLVTQSDIGYTPLEECLTGVVAAAPFPVPAGRERAETQWRMSVDPLGQPAEPLDSTELEDTILRQSEATYESCQIGKGRRFLVYGYLGHGKLQPVTVRTPWRGPARASDDVEDRSCLAQALAQWTHWPKERGYTKVGFELRWLAAPPPPPKRKRAKSRKR